MAFNPKEFLALKAEPVKSAPAAFDPKAFLALKPEEPKPSVLQDIGEGLLSGAQKVGSFIDKYTGAPARAALEPVIESMQDQGSGNRLGLLMSAPGKFTSQFGEDPEKAPTGKQLAQKIGLPETTLSEVVPSMYSETGDEYLKFKKGGLLDPTASGAAGLAIDIAADPTNLIPAKALGQGAGLLVKGTQKAIDLGVAPITKTAGAITKGVEKAAPTVAQYFTGINKNIWKGYSQDVKNIEGLIKKYGDKSATMADDVRSEILDAVKAKKSALNEDVSKALEFMPQDKTIPISSVTDELKKQIGKIDKDLRVEEYTQAKKLLERLESKGEFVSPQEMFQIKNYLQDVASSAYDPNAVFRVGSEVANVAKRGAYKAREATNIASPSIKEANSGLKRLHDIEDNINKNIITPQTPDPAFYSAGAGVNTRGLDALEAIAKETGFDAPKKARAAAIAKELEAANFDPRDITGKAGMRAGMASGVGLMAGGVPGALLTPLLASPKAFREYYRLGNFTADTVRKLVGGTGEITDKVLDAAYRAAQTDKGQKILRASMLGSRAASTQKEKQ